MNVRSQFPSGPRRQCLLVLVLVGVGALSGVAAAQSTAPSTAPSTAASSPAAAQPAAVGAGLPTDADPLQGIVRLERAGRAIGFGMALGRDGRVLSALSALDHGNQIQGRFADQSVSALRVVASDRGSDLALLEPDGVFWTAGLSPSALEPDADGVVLTRYRLRGQRLEPAATPIARRTSLLGRDAAVIDGALVFSNPFRADELGSPVLDAAGQVVAIVAQACSPRVGDGCRLEAYGAPVTAMRDFLRSAPPRRPLPAAWLGFRGVSGHVGQVAGVRVVDVQSGSAAEKAGLLPVGSTRPDLVVAVNGLPVDSFDELAELVNRAALKPAGAAAAPERSVRLLVFGGERFREVQLTLRPPRQAPIEAGSTPTAAADARTEAPVAASPGVPRSPPSPEQPRLAPTPYDPTPKAAAP